MPEAPNAVRCRRPPVGVALGAAPPDLAALDERARAILRGNDRGGYTVPTHGLYPYQWNWDSAFAAWGFSRFDPERAWVEIETLLGGQWPNGMVPHILFHRPDPGYFPSPEVWGVSEGVRGPVRSSGITQPPVAATMLRAVHEAAPDEARLRPLVERLLAWHRWFTEWRLDRGAVVVTHPWESGRDNAPDWDGAMAALGSPIVAPYTRRDTGHVDPAMRPTKADYDRYVHLVERGRGLGWEEAALARDRPFAVADPGMTFVLLRACRDLAALGAAEAEAMIPTLEEGAATLWNPAIGAHDARDVRTGGFSGCVSSASQLAWFAGLRGDRGLAALDRTLGAVAHGVPSHDPDEARFEPRRYWRGPAWPMLNALVARGLAEADHAGRAEALRASTEALIARGGFAEYFDPQGGTPAGGGDFTWTAAVWLAWIRA